MGSDDAKEFKWVYGLCYRLLMGCRLTLKLLNGFKVDARALELVRG